MKFFANVFVYLSLFLAWPSFAVEVPTFHFKNPKSKGFRFHQSVPPTEVCRRLSAGPPIGAPIYRKVGLSSFRLISAYAIRPGGMGISSKLLTPLSLVVSEILCDKPDRATADQFILQQNLYFNSGKRVNWGMLRKVKIFYPDAFHHLSIENAPELQIMWSNED